jgi:hypothetical protein
MRFKNATAAPDEGRTGFKAVIRRLHTKEKAPFRTPTHKQNVATRAHHTPAVFVRARAIAISPILSFSPLPRATTPRRPLTVFAVGNVRHFVLGRQVAEAGFLHEFHELAPVVLLDAERDPVVVGVHRNLPTPPQPPHTSRRYKHRGTLKNRLFISSSSASHYLTLTTQRAKAEA